MNDAERTVCGIVGAALFNAPLPDLTDVDWEAVHQEFLDQTIIAIPGFMVENLPMPEKLRDKWVSEIRQTTAKSIRFMSRQAELTELLEKNDIQYVILKGAAASVYYDDPLLRTTGDSDIFVLPEDLRKAKELMAGKGFRQTEEHDSRHEAYVYRGAAYELHDHFGITDDRYGPVIDELLYREIRNKHEEQIAEYTFRVLPLHFNGLVIIQHIRQHLNSGLGLRQIIDWLVFVNKYLDDKAWHEFKKLTDETGLTTLAVVTARIGQMYFGMNEDLHWCAGADDTVCRELTELLFDYGNFGRKDSLGNHTSYVMNRMRSGVIKTLQYSGTQNWKLLKKCPWLRPFAWIYQIFRYTRQGLQAGIGLKQLKKNAENSRDLHELLEKLGV